MNQEEENDDANDFIMVHEGLVPEDLCDDIIKEFADSEYWNNSTVGTVRLSVTLDPVIFFLYHDWQDWMR